MFYRPAEGHGLQHNPFNAIVTPRPIGWVSTRAEDGSDNLAPYSFFNAIAYVPPQVMFASTGTKPDRVRSKDTLSNLSETGVFCINIVEAAAQDVMNQTAGAWGQDVDEFDLAGIEKSSCREIDCARVASAPAALECTVTDIIPLKGAENFLVHGEVVGVHMRDDCLRDGRFDVLSFNPLSRMGYRDYTIVREIFELKRPGE